MPKAPSPLGSFEALVEIIRILRGPQGCPWDRAQTHASLVRYLLEESAELADAIEEDEDQHLQEELGDVLLQVVLHSVIAEQRSAFGIQDIIQTLSEKMIRRHPHVFADGKATTPDQVVKKWTEIKAEENPVDPVDAFFDFPKTLPSLAVAQKIGERSERIQFDWSDVAGVLEKVQEEHGEVLNAIQSGSHDEQVQEVGDLLFSIVQLARHLKVDADQALRMANRRFEDRFRLMAQIADDQKLDFMKLPLPEKEKLWQKAKSLLKMR